MKVDFAKFDHSLPYASELYGIYQPLLGWRSRVRTLELAKGVGALKRSYLQELQLATKAVYSIGQQRGDPGYSVSVGEPAAAPGRFALDGLGSIVARKVAELVAAAGSDEAAWRRYTTANALQEILGGSQDDIRAELTQVITARHGEPSLAIMQPDLQPDIAAALSGILTRESTVAGTLRRLGEERSPAELAEIMQPVEQPVEGAFLHILDLIAPAKSKLAAAAISPIGLVHLYRQYFFEFDTFLGPPVQHLWLSPGGVVELVEVSTRRTLVERTTEQAFESVEKSDKSTTQDDELSTAVRSENGSNTKLGVTLSSTASYGVGFVNGSTTVGASFNAEQSNKEARENTHRSLRQQTEKLSSEIRKSFKSTFKTVTETTDTDSRRYVIQNTTPYLVNYELRRKMRQVGVQVHDQGLQLCWQAYVDEPGLELGTAKLVHIAAPADLQGAKQPDAEPMPEPEIKGPAINTTIHWPAVDVFRQHFTPLTPPLDVSVPPKPGYIYSSTEIAVQSGQPWMIRAFPARFDEQQTMFDGAASPTQAEADMIDTGDGGKERRVRSVVLGVQNAPQGITDDSAHDWDLQVTFVWKPSQKLVRDVEARNATSKTEFDAEKARAYKEALYTAARDRVTAASNIEPRPFEDLREEERIVVYRNLIRKLLEVAGITDEDPKVRHVFAELVQSMFDVDEMLYFVAPEWWMPRGTHFSRQNIGLYPTGGRVAPALAEFDQANTVDWGGATNRPSDYYITEKSTPARLGSSLGWLLELDGDNLRNAFLNAPWVKAVIPIRPGREWDALTWLSSEAIEGQDGLEDEYQAADAAEKPKILKLLKAQTWDDPALTTLYAAMNDPDQIRIIDAIRYLIVYVQAQHVLSLKPVTDQDDPTLNYLPTDEVFERGFEHLQGGFNPDGTGPFKGFDEWVEVLPTDQIVPVEVEYDPMTGMQVKVTPHPLVEHK